MTVQPIPGEPTRFHVTSESGAEPYLVDLASYKGNGECGCQHFQIRLQRAMRLTDQPAPPDIDTRCKHIKAAREFALDLALASYERQRTGGRSESGI